MSHNTRTQPDATWLTGNYVPTSGDWASLDAKLFKAINGDRGGCWAPSAPIIVDGTNGKLDVTSGTIRLTRGSLKFSGASNLLFQSTSTMPQLGAAHPGRLRDIFHSFVARQSSSQYHWVNVQGTASVQSIACTVQGTKQINLPGQPAYGAGNTFYPNGLPSGGLSALEQPSMILALRVHDRARLVGISVTFQVAAPRSAPPVAPPRFRIVRADLAGNLVALTSIAGGADGNGFVTPPNTSSGVAWYAGGSVQTMFLPCDQNNIVDVGNFTYHLQVIEEAGATSTISVGNCDGSIVRERKADVRVLVSSAYAGAPSGTPTIDGVALVAGDRVLLSRGPGGWGGNVDGIYKLPAATGSWAREPDNDAGTDFTPGFLVYVASGTLYGRTVWECTGPTNAQNITVDLTLTAGVGSYISPDALFQRRQPRGNIYHAAIAHFDSITSLAFQ